MSRLIGDVEIDDTTTSTGVLMTITVSEQGKRRTTGLTADEVAELRDGCDDFLEGRRI